jgi:hypothetical protein
VKRGMAQSEPLSKHRWIWVRFLANAGMHVAQPSWPRYPPHFPLGSGPSRSAGRAR